MIRWNGKKKRANKIGDAVILLLYFVGLTALTLFIGWGMGFILFVIGDSPHPGAIAYAPRSFFFLSIFLVFHRSRPVREFYKKMEKIFF